MKRPHVIMSDRIDPDIRVLHELDLLRAKVQRLTGERDEARIFNEERRSRVANAIERLRETGHLRTDCNEIGDAVQDILAALARAEEEKGRLREALERIMRCTDDFSAEDVARAALDPKGSDQ